ncbi:MAG: hypothetical protein K2P74_11930, partial [Nitrosomonas sp.]|nr:hypothetical protein [Nitrosomonas sp.]
MADTKISLETTASTLDGTEHIPMVQAGANVKSNPNQIINDRKVLTYDPVDNAIDYPPGTTLLDLDTIGGAPVSSQFVLLATDAALPNARVLSNSTTNTVSTAVAGQVQIRSVATTGDVTRPANSTVNTIANDAVTTAKIANSAVTLPKIANASANSKLLGSGDAGSGSPYAELTLGAGLSMSGTTINASVTASGSNATAYKFRFSTTTTQTDPGASYVRLDSTTQAAAVNFAISVTDADSNNMTAVIAFLKKNYRVMFKSVDPASSNFLELRVKSIELIDATHYLINYTRMAGKAFTNDEYIWMTFSAYSGFYLDEDDDRIKRWSDNAIIDGPLVIPDIATAQSSADLDTTISTKHGMTAIVEDPGGNALNPLIETFPWPIMVNYTKNRLEQVGGQCLLAKLSKPVRVTVPTDGLTWTVTDVAGKVNLNAASHGLPALEADTFTYLVAKAGTGWPVGSLHLITAISGNDVSLDTDYDSQGSPDFYAVAEQFTMFSVIVPPLRAWSEVSGRLDVRMSDTTNNKVLVFDLDDTFLIWDAANHVSGTPAPDVFDSLSGVNRSFMFSNAGSTSKQNSNVAKTNNSGIGGTIASGSGASGTVNTATAKTLRLKVVIAT